mmetsp:Transcript_162093/g.393716  ORF Transcript_162093/g.393716 Transcript_162093/m.393716 type:complete len:101 (-) Transcript_162093:278-580(-)
MSLCHQLQTQPSLPASCSSGSNPDAACVLFASNCVLPVPVRWEVFASAILRLNVMVAGQFIGNEQPSKTSAEAAVPLRYLKAARAAKGDMELSSFNDLLS